MQSPYSQPHHSAQSQVDQIDDQTKYPVMNETQISLADIASLHTNNPQIYPDSDNSKNNTYTDSSNFMITPQQSQSPANSDSPLSMVYENVAISTAAALNAHSILNSKNILSNSTTPETSSAKYLSKSVPPIHINVEYPPLRTPEGKFKCRDCNRQYTQMKHLRRHAIMHTGKTPYGCSYCQKRFNRLDICKRHITTCSARKRAACQKDLPSPQANDLPAVSNAQTIKPFSLPANMGMDLRTYPSYHNKLNSYQPNTASISSAYGYVPVYDQQHVLPTSPDPLSPMLHPTTAMRQSTQGFVSLFDASYYNVSTGTWTNRTR